MKILYLNPVGTIGGAEMCLLDILATVGAARPDWRLSVILGDDGPLRAAIESLGLACTVLPLPPALARLGDAGLGRTARASGTGQGGRIGLAVRGAVALGATTRYVADLRRLLRAERPDCVQTNGMKAHLLGTWAAPRGVSVVWHLHDYIGARPVMARLLRRSSRPTVTGVAVSQSVADDAVRAFKGRVPVRTIANAVDLDRFAPGPGDGARLDAAAGLSEAPPGTIRVGLVATFARWKGHDIFLEAAARIAPDRPCRFYIVGGPIYRSLGSQYTLDELRVLADMLGLAGRVGFTGHQAEPAEALRALDVVVHASTRPEPFGRVIAEGMACGRAVVAIRDGGAAEVFEDGVTALGCPPRDPEALASVLDRLIVDPALRDRLGAAGHEAARTRFDRSRLAGEWSTVYETLGR